MQDEILSARYCKNDEKSFEDVCLRVADFIGNTDVERSRYYDMMVNKEFLPNSPTLMNAGCPSPFMSACVVLPIEDTLDSIFDTVKAAAICHQRGAGTGFSFSKLRPNGARVNSSEGKASGPISFMTVFDRSTAVVSQGGSRRGANMGCLRVDHPDILNFIKCKELEGDIKNFNISIMITNKFMDDVISKKMDNVVTTTVDGNKITVGQIWGSILEHAWKNGEPGILFYDTINKANTTPLLGSLESTNPCGELPLLPYESCTLGSINLSKVLNTDTTVNYDKLSELVYKSVYFLDSVVSKNVFPLEQLKVMAEGNRKIGLGIMGFADMLLIQGISYNSKNAVLIGESVMEFINATACKASQKLALLYGTFPNYNKSAIACGNIKLIPHNVRNANLTTIAPTGTISLLADCSSGIEPVFSYVYKRKNVIGKEFMVIHPIFDARIKKLCNLETDNVSVGNKQLYDSIMNYAYENGSIQNNPDIPDDIKRVFVTALDIDWKNHIDIQTAFQKYVTSSISKTINMKESATISDIENAIIMAYQNNLKGMTIYRTNSRKDVVLNLADKPKPEIAKVENIPTVVIKEINNVFPMKRPNPIDGNTYHMHSGCCDLYVTVNHTPDNVYEVFVCNSGYGGGGCTALLEGIGRMMSLALQHGVEVQDIVHSLSKIICPACIRNKNSDGKSCPGVVAKCLNLESLKLKDGNRKKTVENGKLLTVNELFGNTSTKESLWECPDCHSKNVDTGGCKTCKNCGYSKCG